VKKKNRGGHVLRNNFIKINHENMNFITAFAGKKFLLTHEVS